MPKINPTILKWARETAGLTIDEAADSLGLKGLKGGTPEDRLVGLEKGEEEPTRPLLVKMANKYHRPLLVFYMSAPPPRADRGRDFRLVKNPSTEKEAILDALIRDIQARQAMIREALIDEDDAEPVAFVNSYKLKDGIPKIVSKIQETLELDLREFRSQPTTDDAFDWLRAKTEQAGVFVVLIGNLGSHHTNVDADTFRGYAIADAIAPFVVINEHDSRTAWSFTLLHELVHLWLGETGLSGADPSSDVERFCNRVAGQILLPEDEIASLKVSDQTGFRVAQERIEEFADGRNISCSMVTFKLWEAGMISDDFGARLNGAFRKFWLMNRDKKKELAKEKAKETGKSSGPNYYVVRRHRLGLALVSTVSRLVSTGTLTSSKAGKVLGVKGKNLKSLFDTEVTF